MFLGIADEDKEKVHNISDSVFRHFMAGALAGYENWTFDEAFEFVICGLLRMALPTGPARDVTVTIGNVTTTEYKLLKIKTVINTQAKRVSF